MCKGPEASRVCSITRTSRRPSWLDEGQGHEEDPDQVMSFGPLFKEFGFNQSESAAAAEWEGRGIESDKYLLRSLWYPGRRVMVRNLGKIWW